MSTTNTPSVDTASLTVDELLLQALAHHQAGRFAPAEAFYRTILQALPSHSAAHHNLAVMAIQLGRPEDALPHVAAAIEANPADANTHLTHAHALLQTGQPEAAATAARDALARGIGAAQAQPVLDAATDAIRNTAAGSMPPPAQTAELLALFKAQRHGETEIRSRALTISYPAFGFGWKALGAAQQMQGRNALFALGRAANLQPDDPEAWANLGYALREQVRIDEALDCYRRAAALAPDRADSHLHLGGILLTADRLPEAAASYRRALEIDPDHYPTRSNLLFLHNYLADVPVLDLVAQAREYGQHVAASIDILSHWDNNSREDGRALRVGLVSGDFRSHPVSLFLEGVVAAMAPERVIFHAYANHHQEDDQAARLKAAIPHWRRIDALSDEEAAEQIKADAIDILVDLSGHTAHNRLPLFARKPAPIQVSWLGYFATTGLSAMDYILADRWVLPESEAAHFVERLWHLPDSYLCFTPPDLPLTVGPLPALTAGHITFGCLNNLTKINDHVIALWARVLKAVADARLLLKTPQLMESEARRSLVERFAAHGIGEARLLLEGKSLRAEHLATYGRIDIALDPFPYPGGTTSVEALWMGVPVLGKRGDRFLAHVGESILHTVGLPDWIAADEDDYVAKAVARAGDLAGLADLRQGLRQQLLASPLCDAPRFADNLASAFHEMWRQWLTAPSARLSLPPQTEKPS